MIQITPEILKAVAPECKPDKLKVYLPILQDVCEEFGMHNKAQICAFLANCAHESGGFTVFEENLNYSKEGLLRVFKKYFNESNVAPYVRNPKKIASRVYANRLGNGPESSGDGWTHRGRGAIQLTFRDNYFHFGEYLGISLEEVPEYLTSETGRFVSAGWFWMHRAARDLNDVMKDVEPKKIRFISVGKSTCKEFDMTCKMTNGGWNGHEHRVSLFNRIILL